MLNTCALILTEQLTNKSIYSKRKIYRTYLLNIGIPTAKHLKQKGAAPFVDISDFYNSDYLDEIGSTGICDLISGTMTGLGILGTF